MAQSRFNFCRSFDRHAECCRAKDFSCCGPDAMLLAVTEVNEDVLLLWR